MKTLKLAFAVIAASIMVGATPQASATAVSTGTNVLIRETEDSECGSNSPLTIGPNRQVQVIGDDFMYYAGTVIPFRLAQPIETGTSKGANHHAIR